MYTCFFFNLYSKGPIMNSIDSTLTFKFACLDSPGTLEAAGVWYGVGAVDGGVSLALPFQRESLETRSGLAGF